MARLVGPDWLRLRLFPVGRHGHWRAQVAV